jgi:hypothetical protein
MPLIALEFLLLIKLLLLSSFDQVAWPKATARNTPLLLSILTKDL